MTEDRISLKPLDTFGSVAAEDDAVLDYFLTTDAVDRIQSNAIFLVLGRKGSGKTALVRHFTEGGGPTTSKSLNLRGYPWPLHAQRIDRGASEVEAYVSSWRYLIAVELASVALRHASTNKTPASKSLHAFFSENYGGTNPAIGDVLRPPKLKLSGLSFEPQILGNKLGSIVLDRTDLGLGRELDALTGALLRAVKEVAGSLRLPTLLLHFDELDQGLLAMDDRRECMLIGLVLAARSIRSDCRDAPVSINPVVYLRTDLWEELKFSDKNKITQALALNLEWDGAALKQLVNVRLRAKLGDGAQWESVTTPDLMRGSQAKWDHILARTFLRPRDIIQFLNSALEQTKHRTDDPLVFENQDIVSARDRYSAYLKMELDDEIVPHWKRWDDALQACSAISTITFDRDQFVAEYNKRKSAVNPMLPDDALRLLFGFSVIAYERRSGYGGTSWVFRYMNPEAGWDTGASRFKVHLGLKEYAKLREETRARGVEGGTDMAVCVSLINMKGGVGKTTLATQIAWYAVMQMDKKVLLIDLDPQANTSQSVMSPQTWVTYLGNEGLTVADIFEQFTPTGMASGSPKRLNPEEVIYDRATYRDGSLLHLVPSRLELSWTLRNPHDKDTLLPRFVAKVEENYDLIVIDCSPTDSILTDAAYHCSRYVLVPIRAEFLASIGFPLLNRSINAFRMRHEDKVIEVCGLVFNDFVRRNEKREHKLARKDVKDKAIEYGWYVFENDIPHSDSYFRAAREGMPINRTKGAHGKVINEFAAFAEEFFGRIGLWPENQD